MNKSILEVKKISKSFDHKRGKVKIFQEVSLELKKGDLVALVGPSGSGKSTLLHIISLLDKVDTGDIFFNSINLKKLNENEKNNLRKKNISIIFQNNNLLNDFTALENVIMPLIIRNEDVNNSQKKAKSILNEFKLSSRHDNFPSELSGG